MRTRVVALIVSAAALSGCDAATQIAGDAVQGEVRGAVAAQCRQVAESAGIVAGRIAEVCECSAETFVAEGEVSLDAVNPAKIEGIVNECAKRTGAAAGKATPTEEFGG